ncbi:MAG TPA: Ig-like domain-containing protein [Chryseosolibacter sp.]
MKRKALYIVLVGLMAVDVVGQDTRLMESILAKAGGRTGIEQSYKNNKKWVMFAGLPEILEVGGFSAEIQIDLADVAGITEEGKQGWVTIWVSASIGKESENLDEHLRSLISPIGLQQRAFDPNAPDSPDFISASAGASVLVVAADVVIGPGGGEPELKVGLIKEFNVNASINGEFVFEMQVTALHDLLNSSATPGVALTDFGIRLIRFLAYPIFDLISPNPFIRFRFASLDDNPESDLIKDVTGRLVQGSYGEISVEATSNSAGQFYIQVWSGEGILPPKWEWESVTSGVVWLEADQTKTFYLRVKPNSREEVFAFALRESSKLTPRILYKTTIAALPPGTDIEKPQVSFTSPTSGSNISSSTKVVVRAADTGSDISHVDLFINNLYYTVDNVAPYEFALPSGLPVGNIRLTARGYDSNGNAMEDHLDLYQPAQTNSIISSLSNGTVSPSAAVLSQPRTFTVTYKSSTGTAPIATKLIVGTNSYIMSTTGTSWTEGVNYTVSRTFPEGEHQFYFEAATASGTYRYPSSGKLDFVVLPEASGWEVKLNPMNTTYSPSTVKRGTKLTVQLDIDNDGNYRYSRVPFRLELRNQNGNLISIAMFDANGLDPGQSRIDIAEFTVPSDAADGNYTLTALLLPSLDSETSNNSVTMFFRIGASTGNAQFRTTKGKEKIGYNGTLLVNGKPFTIFSINNLEIGVRDPSNNINGIELHTMKVYGSHDCFLTYEGVDGVSAVLYGAYEISDGAVYENTELHTWPGGVYFLDIKAPQGYTFENDPNQFELYSARDEWAFVKSWYKNITPLGSFADGIRVRFEIPPGQAIDQYTLYFKTPYEGTQTVDFTQLHFHVGERPPAISAVSNLAISADDIITITGERFGASGSVWFGNVSATDITSWNSTSIICKVPQNIIPSVITVSSGDRNSNGVPYTVLSSTGAPTITAFIPDQVLWPGETRVIGNLSNTFKDPNGEELLYQAVTTNPHVNFIGQEAGYIADGMLTIKMSASATSRNDPVLVGAFDPGGKSAKIEFRIMVPSKPAVITTGIHNLAQRSITARGSIVSTGGLPLTARGVAWGPGNMASSSDKLIFSPDQSDEFSVNITGLMPGAPYHVRAFASNGLGLEYGAIAVFTTAPGLPEVKTRSTFPGPGPAIPSGGEVVSESGATVTERGVCWSSHPESKITDSRTIDSFGAGAYTSAVTGLLPEIDYFVRAYAVNSVGVGYGNEFVVRIMKSQTIALSPIVDRVLGTAPFIVQVSASSGLPVTVKPITDNISFSSGMVTVNAAGKAILIVEQGGNGEYAAATPVIASFCVNPPKPVITASVVDGLKRFTSSASSGNTWYLDGQPIDGATSPVVEPTVPGNYTVDVRVGDCVSEKSNTMAFNNTVGVEDSDEHVLSVFPVPADNVIYITKPNNTIESLVAIDMLGRYRSVVFEVSTDIISADLTDLPAGTYVLRIKAGKIHMVRFAKR